MKITNVVRNINRGGFGIIDEVVCEDGNHYARKLFSPTDEFKSDKKLCDRLQVRFIREVKTQKVLPNDYFIPILFDDLGSATPYFIMPLADEVYTEEIENCKKECRPPDGLGDILNALEFLHDKGLVHRDLKPQNILKHNGIWKLADFGLITQDKEILSKTITTSKQAFGTTMYCAPEQVVEFNRITPYADIYSFGAILHDIFTDGARVPYSELTASGELGYIIEKCTRHKKELRFKNIKSIRSKLLSLLSKRETKSLDEEDIEWQKKFEDISSWDEDIFENFVFYLKRSENFTNNIFYEITEEILAILKPIEIHLFNDLSLIYLNWVYEHTFNFNYCDVIVNNIYWIYSETKDIEVKSKCVISAAELGKSHNRWYVMNYVVRMGGHSIDDNLAFRVGMDIGLDEKNKVNFIRCAEQIRRSVEAYHKMIKENLV
jgi:serine/threonine protein kinase